MSLCPPTNFVWQIDPAGALVNATWNTPPSSATATQLFTSADDITYALAATTVAPGTSASAVSPAVGAALYGKVRFVGGAFTESQVAWGQVAGWAARGLANSGGVYLQSEINNHNTLWGRMVANAFAHKIIAMLTYGSSNNLIRAITPLVVGTGGNDPWTNGGPFVLADLTIDGLKGDGASKALGMGTNASVVYPDATNGGFTLYTHDGNTNGAVTGSIGVAVAGFGAVAALKLSQGGTTFAELWSPLGAVGQGFVSAAEPGFQGFTSCSRISNTDLRLFHANSGTPFAKIAGPAAINPTPGAQGGPPNGPMTAHGLNVIATTVQYDPQRFSLSSCHYGLSDGETQAFYNAYQAFLVAKGGGFV